MCISHPVLKQAGESDLTETEVRNLDVPDAATAQYVLGLEISVHDAHLMQVGHAFHQGVDHSKRLTTDQTLEHGTRWVQAFEGQPPYMENTAEQFLLSHSNAQPLPGQISGLNGLTHRSPDGRAKKKTTNTQPSKLASG